MWTVRKAISGISAGILTALVSGCIVSGPSDEQIRAALPGAETVTLSESGNYGFVSGALGHDINFVTTAFALEDSELEEEQIEFDQLGFVHERFSQVRNGLRVIGGDLRVSLDSDGEVRAATGVILDSELLEDPSVGESEAGDLALAATEGATELIESELVYVVPSSGGVTTLAWRVEVTGSSFGIPVHDDVFIGAELGELVDRHPRIYTARNRRTFDANNTLQANLVLTEGAGPSGIADVDAAHDAAGGTYDCMAGLFGRDSFDGAGAQLISIARTGDPERGGGPLLNAFWDGQAMYYGQGFANLDVGAHEFAHALTQNTANLIYQNESGAINESASDILAAICDSYEKGGVSATTFIIGEDIRINGQGGFTKNLSDPLASGLPDLYSERYIGPEDNGGVHINAGIGNLAFYLLSEGGVHPRNKTSVSVVGVGMNNATQIFYRALTSYMGTNTNFAQARAAFEQAASDIHGSESSEVFSVREAFSAVGIGVAPTQRPPATTPSGTQAPGIGTVPTQTGGAVATSGAVVGGCQVGNQPGAPMWFILFFAAVFLGRSNRSRS